MRFWQWRWLRRFVSWLAHADFVASLYGRLLPKRVRDNIEGYIAGAIFTGLVTVGGTVLAIIGSMPPAVVYLVTLGSLVGGMAVANQAASWRQRRVKPSQPPPPKASVEVTEIAGDGWEAASIQVENRGPAITILGEVEWQEGYSAALYRIEWDDHSSTHYPLAVGGHATANIATSILELGERNNGGYDRIVKGVTLHKSGGVTVTLNIEPETENLSFVLRIRAAPAQLVFEQTYQLWLREDGSIVINPVVANSDDEG